MAREQQLCEISDYMEKLQEKDKQLEKAFDQAHTLKILEDPLPMDIKDKDVDALDEQMNDSDFNK